MSDTGAINSHAAESSQCDLTTIGDAATSLALALPNAGQALCEYFLANAERGDNAANDQLVAELARRIRAQRSAGSAKR
ncbi:MAG: hypothetical protein ACREX8_03325 [Gammaproteobacteria bacterium]